MKTKTVMTAQEFAQSGPQTDGHELVRGALEAMPPPRDKHGIVCANAVFLLKTYTRQVGHGIVMSNDVGILTEKNPDSVRGVDAALFLHPAGVSYKGCTDVPPDVAVEVRSPGQAWKSLVTKVGEYLRMGVRLVWVVDPSARRVTVFTPDDEPQTLAAENALEGVAALPGFRCVVKEFFEGV